MKLTTVASLIGALANGVQFSEALQVAITGRGSTPLDDLVPPRYRRLAAILQLPLLACLVAGEVAKVRGAFDGEDEDIDWSKAGRSTRFLHFLSEQGFQPNQNKIEWVGDGEDDA